MRIAEIAPPWIPVPPADYGGIELVVDSLARGLQERGHEVTLFAPEGSQSPGELVSPLPPAGTTSMGDAWYEIYHVLSAYARRGEFDVVHDHTLLGTALGAMTSGRPPVLHTLHGPWVERAQAYYDLVHEHVHLVAISESQRRGHDAVRYAATIPNGIELDRYPLSDAPREDFLLYIGRANADKAPELALEVAHRAGLPLKLVVKRAEPAEREYWNTQVAPHLGPDDEALEELTHDEKVDLLRRAKAFVFPIRWDEPFGLVMIEALACGLPVVARPRGAASEIVEHGVSGFLTDELDEFVEAVGNVGRLDPHACRRRVAERFSAEAMVDGYERLMLRLAGREAASAALPS
jgi:glycosyltransferase involved in cell wall biosynthesis